VSSTAECFGVGLRSGRAGLATGCAAARRWGARALVLLFALVPDRVLVARILALAVGGFALANLVGEFLRPGFDANLWWIDCRYLPSWLRHALLWSGGVLLVAIGLWPQARTWRRLATAGILAALLVQALLNAVTFWAVLARGEVRSVFPLPLSLLVAAALAWIGTWLVARRWRPVSSSALASCRRGLVMAIGVAACLVAFPLVQILCFGTTDYRRRADAIVVFGCLAYANGQPSTSLYDRVMTGCDLYLEGYADRLVFSGGPARGGVHETDVMRRLAIERDIPPAAIHVDRGGLDTQSTVENTHSVLADLGARRVLAVSHFYHLPRIKMTYQRAGLDVYTVPAAQSRWIRKTPWSVVREVAALWFYYLRPLAPRSDEGGSARGATAASV